MPVTPDEAVALLLKRLTKAPAAWPPAFEADAWAYAQRWRAHAEGDREEIKAQHIELGYEDRQGKRYRVDKLAGQALDTWADTLVGDELRLTPGDDGDAEQLQALAEENDGFTDDVSDAVRRMVGEGFAFSRIVADHENHDHPTVEFFGRDQVIPLRLGRKLVACALWTELEPVELYTGNEGQSGVVWRHLEIHAEGLVSHHLFAGFEAQLGQARQLVDHPAVAKLQTDSTGAGVWRHGLPMLMEELPNRRAGRSGNRDLGVSDLERAADQWFDLNEAENIKAGNASLAGRKRSVVPEHMLDVGNFGFDRTQDDTTPQGLIGTRMAATFPAGDDVLVHRNLDDRLGHDADSLFKVLEYSYDAQQMITHKRELVETALTRMGLTPQGVGVDTGSGQGYAFTGTAIKLKFYPQTRAALGKRRVLAARLPGRILGTMQQLDALPLAAGGFGVAWVNAEAPPSVTFGAAVPTDEVEQASVATQLVAAGLMSKRQALVERYPEWSPEQIDDELKAIEKDAPKPLAPPLAPPPAPGAEPPAPEPPVLPGA